MKGFAAIAVTRYVQPSGNVVIYFAVVDFDGLSWWWDTGQSTFEWRPLPPHPGLSTSG